MTYIVYQNRRAREAIFARLDHPAPTTLISYWRFLGKRRAGGLLGLYEVLAAYLDMRETGDFTDEIATH